MKPNTWVANYYVANRFGSMVEVEMTFPISLGKRVVESRIQARVASVMRKGTLVYPQVDIRQECRA
jgi:hypothetical protein